MSSENYSCYGCKHLRRISDDIMFNCQHPEVSGDIDEQMSKLTEGLPNLKILHEPQGSCNGWIEWPVKFTPIWIKECTGFQHIELL